MKHCFIVSLLLIWVVLFVGCAGGIPADVESDLEFWICDEVTDFDFSAYQPRFGLMGGREYYGTGYVPEINEDGMQIDPKYAVIYTVTSYPDYASRKQHITRIAVTDPTVHVFGLTLQSTRDEITAAMQNYGFARKEYDNAVGLTFVRGKITVHFTDTCITVRAEVTNFWGIQF